VTSSGSMFRLVKRSSKTGLDQERVGAEPGIMREPSTELSECEKRQLRCPLGSDIRKFSAILPACSTRDLSGTSPTRMSVGLAARTPRCFDSVGTVFGCLEAQFGTQDISLSGTTQSALYQRPQIPVTSEK
jgi:hypothetical protein